VYFRLFIFRYVISSLWIDKVSYRHKWWENQKSLSWDDEESSSPTTLQLEEGVFWSFPTTSGY
jgi:hypothetical protein